ncbi:MAG: efflux RND transporter periplasmic adaptor subunit [Myxococcota bacterium]
MNGKVLTTVLVCVAIVAVALGMASGIVALKPEVKKTGGEAPPTPVTVLELNRQPTAVIVRATGTVEPAQSVDLVPEVAGRIVSRSSKLLPGGRFKKGELLARIDSRQYALAVAQEKARVRSAALELELEKGRVQVAAREWELLRGDKPDSERSPLALRQSQLEAAKVNLEAAESGLSRARLDLERAALRSPFNATVVSESLDLGQRVGANAAVARLVGTDVFWVRVGVRVEELAAIAIPGAGGDNASKAMVTQSLSDGTVIERPGTVLRLIEEIDPQTRRAQLLIEVPNPLRAEAGTLPLLPGAYVDVAITGREMPGIAQVPSEALRDGDSLWAVRDGKLERLEVQVAFVDDEFAYIRAEVEDGTQVVTSAISNPIAGMPVEMQGTATAARE